MDSPDAGRVVRTASAAGLRPEPDLLVSEWADAHRFLPQRSSAEPGPWRTARTPYLREPMDNMSTTSEVEETVLMWAAQLGKTEGLLNVLGYIIDHAPGPVMLVQPTLDLVKRFSRQRVAPLIEDTPRLAGKVAEAHSRDGAASMQMKEFMGGVLVLAGANAAAGLRSMPARVLLADEIDAYPQDVDEEGSPLDLAEARQRTFARRKRMKTSTPGIAGASAIEAAYEASDQRRYYVPCPHCDAYQPLEFERLVWTRLGLRPEQAVYLCRACEEPIEESAKPLMLERGEWRAENPDADPKVRGYHLNALYSPLGWYSWGELARDFVRVYKKPLKLKVFTNTVLAEPWQERGEAPEWERLHERAQRGLYTVGTVPAGGLVLTAGADVQKDRIVVEVVAWGRGKASYSVDYGVLPGNTADLEGGPWRQLSELMDRTYTHEHGAELPIRMLVVDSGYNTQEVYTWCRQYPMNRVIAAKGIAKSPLLVGTPTPVDITLRGKRPVYGYKVWPVCGSIAKTELYGWLGLEPPEEGEPPPPGYCTFPSYDAEFFQQLTAEHLVQHRNKRGFVSLEWELIPGRENHILDCRVYARAAAAVLGIDRWKEVDYAAHEAVLAPGGPPPRPPRPPRPAGWLRRR